MKKLHIVILVLLVLIADQFLKFYIKTSFPLNTSRHIAGDWFQLYFVENPGMAYGWKFGGNWGKMVLTIFRLGAVIFGTWYLGKIISKKYHRGFIICAGLIYAGALGNLIDSCFYGLIFDKGMVFDPAFNDYMGYQGLAKIASPGYSGFLHGNVVDMLYFPVIHGTFPDWFPVWGSESFEFFRPIFNLADASISVGVFAILIFQKRFFHPPVALPESTVETGALVDDNAQVQ
ncbi:MAG: lipoprotein signal peptidase [Ferruginibacter sp.]